MINGRKCVRNRSWGCLGANLVKKLSEEGNDVNALVYGGRDHLFLENKKYRYYSSDKARKELGWKPKQSFRESVRKAIEFYEKNGLI